MLKNQTIRSLGVGSEIVGVHPPATIKAIHHNGNAENVAVFCRKVGHCAGHQQQPQAEADEKQGHGDAQYQHGSAEWALFFSNAVVG